MRGGIEHGQQGLGFGSATDHPAREQARESGLSAAIGRKAPRSSRNSSQAGSATAAFTFPAISQATPRRKDTSGSRSCRDGEGRGRIRRATTGRSGDTQERASASAGQSPPS